jgi:DNA (cytosine-5)-methyltransferase 1
MPVERPVLLDLYCGAGGAAKGYHDAGFDLVGVDINPQPNYPYEFHQSDALEFVAEHGQEFDAIHASPPCQGYSIMRNLPWLRDREYPLLIGPTQAALESLGVPWVIENVMGAKLSAGWLCGGMFGLPFYRHRYFHASFFWMQPGHPKHQVTIRDTREDGKPDRSGGGRRISLSVHPNPVNTAWRKTHDGNGAQKPGEGVGHAAGWHLAAEAMCIDWMKRDELTQAIPPAYTQYIGERLRESLGCP